MLSPKYLEDAPESMVELYAQAETDILVDMARRISTYDYFIPAAEHQLRMLEKWARRKTMYSNAWLT